MPMAVASWNRDRAEGDIVKASEGCELPGQLQESLGPFGTVVSRGVPPRGSPKTGGVRRSVRRGVSGALRAPETPRRTLRRTRTLRARSARKTPVAGRGVRKVRGQNAHLRGFLQAAAVLCLACERGSLERTRFCTDVLPLSLYLYILCVYIYMWH